MNAQYIHVSRLFGMLKACPDYVAISYASRSSRS
jgi:hypothetical protein